MKKLFLLIGLVALFCYAVKNALAADSVTLPSNYTVNAADWVTLADSGTTPAISGFTNAFAIVSTTAGNIKITTTTSLAAVNGFCGYDETNEKTGGDYLSGDEPSDCNGSSLTELGFTGTQAAVNTALATLQFKGSNPTITIKAYETDSDPVHYYKETGHFYKVVRAEDASWSTAVNAAEADSYLGLSGYLAHITSQGEDEFIFYIYDNHSHAPVGTETAWTGGTDRSAVSEDGIWLWEGGPSDEHLKIFFCDSDDAEDDTGGAQSSCEVDSGFEYENWNTVLNPAQPDDEGGTNSQTLAVIIHDPASGANGTWGDVLYKGTSERDHYIIEYNHEDTLDTNNYATNSVTLDTSDTTLPTLSSSSPADDDTCVSTDANIVLTFSEAVDVESGNITIKKTSDDSTVETIDVTSSQVTGTGTTAITIDPSDFTFGIEYYVLIDSTAFDDASSNSYAGISSTTALSFSTQCDVWDTTTKAINKAQSFTARQIIRTSIDMVTERMEFTRNLPHNISEQGIQLALDTNNEDTNEVLNSLQPHLLNLSGRLFDQWSIWTRGNISTGRLGQTNDALGQNIHSDGLTIGIDRKTVSNNTIGIAFARLWRETTIGSNNANIDTDSFNIIHYGSIMPQQRDWFDFIIGYGELDIDIIRKVGSDSNTANRDGRQIFGSFKYTAQPKESLSNFTNTFFYSRLDAGYTSLNEYTETGSNKTISYNKQHIQVATFALGTTLNKEIENNKGTIIPFLRFEFGANGTNHSLSEASFTATPSQIGIYNISDDATAHGRFGAGIEADFNNNWEIRATYDYYYSTDDSFTNNVYLTLKKKF